MRFARMQSHASFTNFLGWFAEPERGSESCTVWVWLQLSGLRDAC